MAIPGITLSTVPSLTVESAQGLLQRSRAVLKAVDGHDPEEPLPSLWLGIASRLRQDIDEALSP